MERIGEDLHLTAKGKELVLRDIKEFPPISIYACTKDERIDRADVAKGKVRLFLIFPFPRLVHLRYISVPLLAEVNKHSFAYGVLSGINPHSPDFDRLARFLQFSPSVTFIDGDYSSFDYIIPKGAGEAVYEWIVELFPPSFSSFIRRALTTLQTFEVFIGTYRFTRESGNCTGQPLTLLFNSMVNRVMIWTAIFAILKSRPSHSSRTDEEILDEIKSNIRDVYFGDDHIIAVGHLFALTTSDLCAQFKRMNIKYTTPDKTQDFRVKNKIEEVSFLKRRFWKGSSGRYAGLLSPSVIFEMIMWNHDQKVPLIERIDAIVEAARAEIALYGPDAQELFEALLRYIYGFELHASLKRYNYLSRMLEVDMFTVTSPDFFFSEFASYFATVVKQRNDFLPYIESQLKPQTLTRLTAALQ